MSNNIYFAADATLQSSASGTGAGTTMAVGGVSGVLLQVSGSFTATIVPQVQLPGIGYVTLPVVNINTLAVVLPATGITAPGLYWVPCSGADQLQANISAYTSGNVTVTAKATIGEAPVSIPALMGAQSLGNANVGGLAGSGSSYSGNPVAMGAEFLQWANLPAVATGQAVSLIADQAGTLKVGVAPLGTPIYGSTDSGGAGPANVTLTIPANKMGFLDGFDVDGLGATAGSAIAVTVTGILGGTLTFRMPIVAGATTPNPTFSKRFNPPLQASAVNTNIVVNVPSFGAGNTASSNNAYGHYV